MSSLPSLLSGYRRDDTASVDSTDIRGLATACLGYVVERPQSKRYGQLEGCLLVDARVLPTGPSRPGCYRFTVVSFRLFSKSS